MSNRLRIIALLLPLMGLSRLAHAESFFGQFRDDDNWLDVGDWVLDNAAGFLPVPIVITEPAVGGGFGAAAIFFHTPRGEASGRPPQDDAEYVLPDITGIVGAATSNDSWIIGGGHFAHWRDDHLRYEGMLGYASLNLEFFGFVDGFQDAQGVGFNTKGLFTQHSFSVRIGDSDWFVGGSWDLYKLETAIDLGIEIPGVDPLQLDVELAGLELFVTYDNLDNMFTPGSGLKASFSIGRKDEAIGSDAEYDLVEASLHGYWQLGESVVLGGRLDAEGVNGDVPFFVLPFIDLRGIQAARYQGENVVVVEAEARWSFHPRLSLVGFAGLGKVANSFSDLAGESSRATKGVGFRYFVARRLGIHMGIDVARGPEDTFWYLTFGSAWE